MEKGIESLLSEPKFKHNIYKLKHTKPIEIQMQQNLTKFFEEDKWAMQHYKELQEKYPDEWVVIKGNKVVKHGSDIEQTSDEYGLFVSSGAEIL